MPMEKFVARIFPDEPGSVSVCSARLGQLKKARRKGGENRGDGDDKKRQRTVRNFRAERRRRMEIRKEMMDRIQKENE
ncbi:hypothetical protein TNCV_1719891 [Trichonephila clavipes]|nr:hypothetical protein TNCV_1719891 [Trichonephila clavipes]